MKWLKNFSISSAALFISLVFTLCLLIVPTANAQTVGTYVEQATGNTKQGQGVVILPGAGTTFWRYVPPTGGITNSTTGVVVRAAPGANQFTYVHGGECYADPLGAATDLELRDGAAGAAVWRTKIPTSGYPTLIDITFDPPIRLTGNTLLEMATVTASVTGSVYCNWRGQTATN